MALPLLDIRVVEICQVFAGPMAGMLLADQGADVIKIEPSDGDSSRPAVPYLPEVDGMSVRYVSFNRNKRSIALDIGKPKGRQVVYNLLRQADVMLINMRVEARQRAGMTYEDVAAVNPKVIYAAITGYGEYGPAARHIVYGVLPPNTALYHFDMSAPMLLVYGVMLALRQREITGVGRPAKFCCRALARIHRCGAALGLEQGVRAVGRDGPRSIPINGAGGGLWLELVAPMAVLGSGAGAGSAGQHAREDNRGPGRCDSVGWLSSLVDVSGAVGAVRQAMAGLAIEPGRE